MLEDDAPVLHADGTRRKDEFTLAQRQDGAAHEAGILHPLRHDQQDNRVGQAAADDGNEGDCEKDERHGELQVGKTHDQHVPEAAIITGDQADHHAEDDGADDGGETDQKRDLAAGNDTGQHVTPKRIGAERMRR
ncbi:hypothetical protein D3C80_1395870 [compost metagenome]